MAILAHNLWQIESIVTVLLHMLLYLVRELSFCLLDLLLDMGFIPNSVHMDHILVEFAHPIHDIAFGLLVKLEALLLRVYDVHLYFLVE